MLMNARYTPVRVPKFAEILTDLIAVRVQMDTRLLTMVIAAKQIPVRPFRFFFVKFLN